ncbi:hypothetical protein AVP42_00501 [Agromyces sp. NDB4Y10]|uniref:DUF7363 domain-containing protein n=1 Tax=Agromyces sp. NDB4Y10 TaxID=1775951 RepID=UPI0007B1CFAD|nr:hypothetical protein [Agromyces sp. NDB4Y10]KZE95173.1 hypothetical protein AVP42_00501 [Agromyces sp. NDB4Y10]
MLQEGRAAVEAHAEAQVKPIVAVGSATTVRVVLTAAPHASGRAADGTATGGRAVEPATRHLSVSVEPHGLKLALGVRRTRSLRLSPGGRAAATFRLVGVEPGPGAVPVVIRSDDGDPLATLQLTVEVVGSGDHDQTGVARVSAVVPARPVLAESAAPAQDDPEQPAEPVPPAGEVTAAGSGSTA